MSEAAARVAEAEPPLTGIAGALEVATPSRIAGWAVDRRAPGRPVQVEIRCAGATLGRVPADRLRADLARAGVGDGRHGFEWRPVEPLSPKQLAEIDALALAGPDAAQRIPLAKRGADGRFVHPAPSAAPAWIGELAALCRSIDSHAHALATAAARPATHDRTGTELQELMGVLSERLRALDGLQPRLDAIAAGLAQQGRARPSSGSAHRGLGWAVAGTALLAATSLAVGCATYFFPPPG